MLTTSEYSRSIAELMSNTRHFLNGLGLIPRTAHVADPVLLGLLSKSIVLTEAILTLVEKGFFDEAFGLCRTSVEIGLIVRYLTNTDTFMRSRRYAHYFAKVKTKWVELYKRYYPGREVRLGTDAAELERVAAEYRSPHKWSEHELKDFASEPDSFEKRDDGSAVDAMYTYEVVYKWMSYYVHGTQPSIDPSHVAVPGKPFTVHPRSGIPDLDRHALLVAHQVVYLNLVRVLRFLNYEFPESLDAEYARIRQSTRDIFALNITN
jgi:hypothetical protein